MEVESRSPDTALYLSFGRAPCLGFLIQPPFGVAYRSDIDLESHSKCLLHRFNFNQQTNRQDRLHQTVHQVSWGGLPQLLAGLYH